MHIEPGFIHAGKVVAANVAASVTLLVYAKDFVKKFARTLLRTALAALFFSLFMQAFHMSVGPSELHFVGAMVIYLTLGFLPTLYGFALGLLLQGALFEPTDLPHLAVNSLSLIVPLLVVHYSMGKKILEQKISSLPWSGIWRKVIALDALYYSGVTLMVGFWLIGEGQTTFVAWGWFALSYLPVVLLEPIFSLTAVALLKTLKENSWARQMFALENI